MSGLPQGYNVCVCAHVCIYMCVCVCVCVCVPTCACMNVCEMGVCIALVIKLHTLQVLTNSSSLNRRIKQIGNVIGGERDRETERDREIERQREMEFADESALLRHAEAQCRHSGPPARGKGNPKTKSLPIAACLFTSST